MNRDRPIGRSLFICQFDSRHRDSVEESHTTAVNVIDRAEKAELAIRMCLPQHLAPRKNLRHLISHVRFRCSVEIWLSIRAIRGRREPNEPRANRGSEHRHVSRQLIVPIRGAYCAALGVTKDDKCVHAKCGKSILKRAKRTRILEIPRDANNEQISHALIKQNFGRRPAIRASKHSHRRRLPKLTSLDHALILPRMRLHAASEKSLIPKLKFHARFPDGNARSAR